MEELNRITKEAQRIRLTSAERSRIRTHLLAHMAKHPPVAPLASPYLSFFYAHPALRGGAFAFALVLMVGGGSAAASEGALPGEILYPVKVQMVEPVIGALQFSKKAEADWGVQVVERRLHETDELKAGAKLDEGALDRVAGAFIDAERKVEALEKEDQEAAGEVRASFAATLEEHEDIFIDFAPPAASKQAPVIQNAMPMTIFSATLEATTSATTVEDEREDSRERGDDDADRESIKKFRDLLHLEDEQELEFEIEKD